MIEYIVMNSALLDFRRHAPEYTVDMLRPIYIPM